MMELSDLRVFRAVVEAGGITRAAERLHRVQSNVTTRIKKLEDDVGAALFVREGKRMQLTAAGKVLLGYAEELLALAERAREALHETRPRGVLRLGAMESTAAVRLPAPLTELHDRHPELTVELHTGAPREMIAAVLAGELDAALVAEPASDPRLETMVVYHEELVVVAARHHAPIGAPADVQSRTMLAFHPGCPHRQKLEEWFAADAVPIERIVEVASYHAILGCAVAGMGVALMPRSVLDTYTQSGRLSVHALRAPFGATKTLLIWRKEAPRIKIMALAELLMANAGDAAIMHPAARGGSRNAAGKHRAR